MEPVELFQTPESWDDLQNRLEELSGAERTVAMTFTFMAWNLACKIAEREKENLRQPK